MKVTGSQSQIRFGTLRPSPERGFSKENKISTTKVPTALYPENL